MMLPRKRLIVGGVDISKRYQLHMTDDYVLNPPAVIEHVIEVPGRLNGPIDMTDSLYGDTSYGRRMQEFVFKAIRPNDFEYIKTDLSNFLHGRIFNYEISFDPGYTYRGRFNIDEYYSKFHFGHVKITISAEPYKTKKNNVYKLNAFGGVVYRFESGRLPVHPVVETLQPTLFFFNGVESRVGKGTFRLNDVIFRSGWNELYVNSFEINTTVWEDLSEDGRLAATWGELSGKRWSEVQSIAVFEDGRNIKSWEIASSYTWEQLSDTQWRDLSKNPDAGTSIVYLTYDWKDL